MKLKLLLLLFILAAVIAAFFWRHNATSAPLQAAKAANGVTALNSVAKKATVAQPAAPKPAQCKSNQATQAVIVSLSQQHMWACQSQTVVYDNPIITGMNAYDDSTPLGSYKIYSKLTDQSLKGCDSSGCWNDPVSYWLPYQQASGGTVGFHDATWRQPTDFGNIAPASNKGSHGCVEMPLAAAKWLYGWSAIGTSVTIET
jgi:hypothetical protein